MSIYFDEKPWKVTSEIVRTPKKTFALAKLDGVSLKRTFFLFTAAPAVGGIGITFLWWRYLFPGEIIFILSMSLVALVISFQFGVLKVEALSLKDDEGGTVYGRYSHLCKIRNAIEEAMQQRVGKAVGERA